MIQTGDPLGKELLCCKIVLEKFTNSFDDLKEPVRAVRAYGVVSLVMNSTLLYAMIVLTQWVWPMPVQGQMVASSLLRLLQR